MASPLPPSLPTVYCSPCARLGRICEYAALPNDGVYSCESCIANGTQCIPSGIPLCYTLHPMNPLSTTTTTSASSSKPISVTNTTTINSNSSHFHPSNIPSLFNSMVSAASTSNVTPSFIPPDVKPPVPAQPDLKPRIPTAIPTSRFHPYIPSNLQRPVMSAPAPAPAPAPALFVYPSDDPIFTNVGVHAHWKTDPATAASWYAYKVVDQYVRQLSQASADPLPNDVYKMLHELREGPISKYKASFPAYVPPTSSSFHPFDHLAHAANDAKGIPRIM